MHMRTQFLHSKVSQSVREKAILTTPSTPELSSPIWRHSDTKMVAYLCQTVVLFKKLVETWGGGTSLRKTGHYKWVLEIILFSVLPIPPVWLSSSCLPGENETSQAHTPVSTAFCPTVWGQVSVGWTFWGQSVFPPLGCLCQGLWSWWHKATAPVVFSPIIKLSWHCPGSMFLRGMYS